MISRSALVTVTIAIVCYSVYVLVFGGLGFHHKEEQTSHHNLGFDALKRLMERASLVTSATESLPHDEQQLQHQQQQQDVASSLFSKLPALHLPSLLTSARSDTGHSESAPPLLHGNASSEESSAASMSSIEALPDVPRRPLTETLKEVESPSEPEVADATKAPETLEAAEATKAPEVSEVHTTRSSSAGESRHRHKLSLAPSPSPFLRPKPSRGSTTQHGAPTTPVHVRNLSPTFKEKKEHIHPDPHAAEHTDATDAATLAAAAAASRGKAHAGLPKLAVDRTEWCLETRKKYNVQPMRSWGTLPLNLMETWRTRRCDVVFTSARMTQRAVTQCPKPAISLTTAPVLPLIAIMAATTTRKVVNPSTENLSLFTLLLPSLIRSVDCGFRYVYVLGYDKGDPFYDNEATMTKIKKWFKDNIETPMSANGVSLTMKLVEVNNSLKKPGPVFIAMARAAFTMGADYFYRINDDTELTSHWPTAFVGALSTLPPPFGVVGPTCTQGNNRILTHDFVSRTHMEVFEMNYYPPELTDWWMDDWISLVYGQQRTFRAERVHVIHHTGAHGQRYQVDPSHEGLLANLVYTGRQKIRKWMLTHNRPEKELVVFDKDEFRRVMHQDIPSSAGS